MNLSSALIPSYIELAHPGADAASRSRLEARLADPTERDRIFVALGDDGKKVVASLRFAEVSPEFHLLLGPAVRPGHDARLPGLLREAMDHGRSVASKVLTRPSPDVLTEAYADTLIELGFVCLGERVEYQRELDGVPEESGSPLTFRTLAEVGREEAARLMGLSREGDPGRPTDDDPQLTLDEALANPDMTNDDGCFQVGSIDGEDAAVVLAQVCPDDGWSTITFMGVLPEFRGRGLGKWVQRRGFAILRERGGTLYHDGTMASNEPMVRVFEEHGCVEYGRMVDYSWRAPSP